ncbi:hypothetical protein ERW49_19095 [Aliivibrio finisterrensis]|uniref:Uncharacterized protein n=1 Tax=Aliivibrio finisterrensis TaxID=511998 RepID=A0A4Q5K2W8_9GAMM|nr:MULTISPECIES: hypothetical protein [Aliivibrio]MDD9177095.1 hypothetical protein [Aliivibrio sp. S3TY1]MDD9194142.1 hypothetical protein [Aliivibrio sp. S2TY2]RYU39976.1 hypothetical protein ERW49_19095 [Aliivibrio finisterrensis]
MSNVKRSNLLLALAEILQDIEMINTINEHSENLSNEELDNLEDIVLKKVMAYRLHDKWPPKIESITKVMQFNS